MNSTASNEYTETIWLCSKPEKLIYIIGEELDLTGGTAEASGSGPDGMMWDIFEKPIWREDYFIVDSSEFDNKKAGEYRIYVAPKLVPDSRKFFAVTVLDGYGSEN